LDQIKTIQVKDETKRKLVKLGSKGDTYDDIIRKLIHSHLRLTKLIQRPGNTLDPWK